MVGRLSDIRKLIGPNRFGRSVAMLAGGTALGQAMVLLASPVLTRLFTTDEFGLLGLYTTFVLMAGMVTSARYELAIPSASDDREAAYLATVSLLLIVPISAMAMLVLMGLKTNSWLGYGEYPGEGVAVLFVALLVGGAFSVGRYWLIRSEEFALISQIAPLQQGGRVVSQVSLGFAGFGWMGLALGDLIGRLVGTGRVMKASVREIVQHLAPIRRSDLSRAASKFRRFPLLIAPSSFFDKLGALIPLPLIAQQYGLGAAGLFTLVQRALGLPSALIGQSVADVFHARIGKLKNEPRTVEKLLVKTAGWLLLVGVIPALVLVVAGPGIFSAVFGSDWNEAGRIAAAMTPWFVAELAVSPISRVAYVFEGQHLKFVYDFLTLGLTIVVFLWGSAADISVVSMVLVLSITNALTYIVYYFLLLRIVRKGSGPSVE